MPEIPEQQSLLLFPPLRRKLRPLRAVAAAAIAVAVAAAVAPPASAGTGGKARAVPARDPCQVAPQDGPGKVVPDESLAERLEDCEGVLAPPPTGDPEMVEPAPDVGRTPVIPPSAIPEQRPSQSSDDAE